MRPLAQSDGHDAPWLIDELVPCLTAMVDEIVVGFEDAIREPVVAHELPNILDRIELGAFWRQSDYRDVRRHDEVRRHVPARLIDQENRVGTWRDDLGDFREEQIHRLGVAGRQDEGCTLALPGADCAKDVGGRGTLVARRTWAGATLRPPAGDLVFLADPSLIRKPDFYLVAVDRLLARDCVQASGEVFLKSSIAPSACAWWRGRAESLR